MPEHVAPHARARELGEARVRLARAAELSDPREVEYPPPREAFPFGLTLDAALSGVSRLRNRVIGRVFRELKLIEQWGSGIGRMIAACKESGLHPPRFEEIGTSFRVTLFGQRIAACTIPDWHNRLLEYLVEKGEITTKEAANLWKTSDRTARTRLRKLVNDKVLAEVATGPRDPKKTYVLKL